MEKKTITIAEYALLEAYKNGNADQKELLERLYGIEMFRPNIMDRVKTFDDAVNELGKGDPLVKEYHQSKPYKLDNLAFLKLRIITAALNEGWEPTFAEYESCYYPIFRFLTKEEYNNMSENDRANVFVFDKPIVRYVGLAYSYSDDMSSTAHAYVDSRICFKTEELAEYAAKQFIDIFVDFYVK